MFGTNGAGTWHCQVGRRALGRPRSGKELGVRGSSLNEPAFICYHPMRSTKCRLFGKYQWKNASNLASWDLQTRDGLGINRSAFGPFLGEYCEKVLYGMWEMKTEQR